MPWWLFPAILTVHATFYFVFAFKEPGVMRHWFRVPAIFVFVPEPHGTRIGRIIAGLLELGLAAFLAYWLHFR